MSIICTNIVKKTMRGLLHLLAACICHMMSASQDTNFTIVVCRFGTKNRV